MHRAEVDIRRGLAKLVKHPDLGGDQHRVRLCRSRLVDHLAGGQDLHPISGHGALVGQIQRGGRTTALGMDEEARVWDGVGPFGEVCAIDPRMDVALAGPDSEVVAAGPAAYVRADELVGAEQHLTLDRDGLDHLHGVGRRAAQSDSAFTSAVILTYETTTASGCCAFHSRSWAAVIESVSEHRARASGISTVLSGARIFAVSAMKRTPQNTIVVASPAAANPAQCEGVAGVVGDVLDLRPLVVMRQDHRVALGGEPSYLPLPGGPDRLETVENRRINTPPIAHEVIGAVLQVRDGTLRVLLWRRARAPHRGRWSLPGGRLRGDEAVEPSIRRQQAEKVDVRQLAHLEQLSMFSEPSRRPGARTIATAFLALVPSDVDARTPDDTSWHPVSELPPTAFDHRVRPPRSTAAFDHADVVHAAHQRLRAKLSYTSNGYALAPHECSISTLRDLYSAPLGYRIAATNLQRVLTRRNVLSPTDRTEPSGRTGGRPAALYRFTVDDLEITDPSAIL